MKKLIVALPAAFFMCIAFACADDVGPGVVVSDTTAEATDVIEVEADVTEDTASSGDGVVSTDIQSDSTSETDVVPEDGVEVVEVDVSEELPSDPTENPEGSDSDSAFYAFPEWNVPPSSDDNR